MKETKLEPKETKLELQDTMEMIETKLENLPPPPPDLLVDEGPKTDSSQSSSIGGDSGTASMVWDQGCMLGNMYQIDCSDCEGKIRFIQSAELPFGWEKVEDPHYGCYYIDHVNRKTQYENPVVQAKRAAGGATGGEEESPQRPHKEPPGYEERIRPFFTKNPAELKGEFMKTELVKSPRGFGFTIVGGDDNDAEFLQIKNVVPNGPAYEDGILKTGDILVHVNDRCVLGFTHQDVVAMFQTIPPGEHVLLEICRGYPLPFDPNDPNTEIVTTVAVTMPPNTPTSNTPSFSVGSGGADGSASRGHNLNNSILNHKDNNNLSQLHNQSGEVPHMNGGEDTPDILSLFPSSAKPELFTIHIVKGTMGFGFTIADSAYGQKVKQILDKPRCKTLQEGDILVEINHIRVKDMSHSEVVLVLKSCPKGQETAVVIQRGGMLTPSKGRKTSKSPKNVEDRRGSQGMEGNVSGVSVPNAFFYSPDSSIASQSTGQSKEAAKPDILRNDSYKKEEGRKGLDQSENQKTDLFNDSQVSNRSRTPTPDRGPTADDPAKTPTPDNPNQSTISGRQSPSREYFNAGQGYYPNNRPPFTDQEQSDMPRQHPRGGLENSYRPEVNHSGGYDPRRDPHPPQYRPDPRAFEEHEFARFGPEPNRREYRSRTPGPDHMGRQHGADHLHQRSKTPNPQEMRSRTPTHDHLNISGTPDFIPASRYMQPKHTEPPLGPLPNHHGSSGYHSRSSSHSGPHEHFPPQQHGKYPPPPLPHHPGDRYHPSPQNYPQNYPPPHPHHLQQAPASYHQPQSRYAPHDPLYHPGMSPGQRSNKNRSTSFEHAEPVPARMPPMARQYSPGASSPGMGNISRGSQPPPPHRGPGRPEDYAEMTVFLRKHENGFGFRIIGGTEEGSQVSVGHIVPGGASEMDGRLRTGDEIVTVDGQPVLNASHHKVVELMGAAGQKGCVTLVVRRRIPSSRDTSFQSQPDGMPTFPYNVSVTRRDNEGFGFVIISSVTKSGSNIGQDKVNDTNKDGSTKPHPPPRIGRIIENSPAERCGMLRVGDRILAVNGIDISRMNHEEIVNVIKDSGMCVTLTVGPPPEENPTNTPVSSQRGSQSSMINAMAYPAMGETDSMRRGDPVNQQILERHKELARRRMQTGSQSESEDSVFSEPPVARFGGDQGEDQIYVVELHRGSRGFGFSIRGGQEFNNMPLYVLRIADGGAANMDGRLRVGDQILEINNIRTQGMTHAAAIDIIQSGGSRVRLLVKRTGKPPPNFERGSSPGRIISPHSPHGQPNPSPLTNGPISHSSPQIQRRMQERQDYFYDYSDMRPHPNY
ncbi:membrane-associated guanylate kinase, WW and PDZ domain-containing protein 1 isoform X2 [Lingula anatina]|uniref:Membrane-associated guanylate kinase, WW and PDZ domain-containing protein 1 isoform X2 n=1 Tax=Lingula anatina TaxID=7574 RepID=A0A1S3HK39_LINAN|nr:membrane-associated guanylate kinase, WW and PDZ domain-containing protein 1 isoform X2 [Lingula anatina]XP_013385357.1 membrane-associated guanylate kinase, WW and PDZ domain-containing protein 1 isoform X2 [Lingula anatina]XP_013385358.1 membrane-associated guanylate kinase, WW and PDZ domain-containing protein 1 isoform X2 [Lingula anatina]XP_013385359.1 membrane-associated guanylate kinase, WW and PDZ domain-containing protein 1 isoform X2 [Lingula anatina]|eukprot:XP_013385356.1 membrane-associated guanylate kinase, WW and PDZ domain-containing protein 1 isoform X2 [Lingula anatina]